MNRAAVDEEVQCEILKIFELEKPNGNENENFEKERHQKGMDFRQLFGLIT